MPDRRGFTLVETLIALTLLGVAASVMVAPLYKYARDVNGVSMAQARNGVMAREVGRLVTLPFDSLASRAGCTAGVSGALSYTRCVTVTTPSASQRRLAIVITPAAGAGRADTVTLDRLQSAGGNPFALP